MTFIKKINKYLIEHYPTIWNTRLVWMLGVAILIHLVFFIIGYSTVHNQEEAASQYNLESFYFDTSIVFIGILISIIVLLIWIIYYLQNNAFKNLYHLKKGTLFLHFSIILFIFFINTTQFYSFKSGLTLKLKNLYDWELIDNDIKKFNNVGVFLLRERGLYHIENKKYPEPFPLKYSKETQRYLGDDIDTTKTHFYYLGDYYQFYKLDRAKLARDFNDPNHNLRENNNFNYRMVKDVSKYKNLINGSLLNYSSTLFRHGQDSSTYKKRIIFYENLLNKKDEEVIKTELTSFYNLAKKYNVKHNLNTKDWLYLINTKNNYNFTNPILKAKITPRDYEYKDTYKKYYRLIKYQEKITLKGKNKKEVEKLKKVFKLSNDKKSVIVTKFKEEYFSQIPYCDLNRLDQFFKNIHEAYNPDFQKGILYFFIGLSFVLALLLFLFKVTNIKTLLLSFVAASVVLIIIILTISLISKATQYSRRNYLETLVPVLTGVLTIITSFTAFKLQWKKLITAILFSLTLFAIPLTLLFSVLLYKASFTSYDLRRADPFLNWFDNYGFWAIMSIWLLCVALYTIPIRKWKGLPE